MSDLQPDSISQNEKAPAEFRSARVVDEKIEVLCLFYTLIDADYNPHTVHPPSEVQQLVQPVTAPEKSQL